MEEVIREVGLIGSRKVVVAGFVKIARDVKIKEVLEQLCVAKKVKLLILEN